MLGFLNMNKSSSKNHSLLIFATLITLIHFSITSIFGHYVSHQIGSQIGHVVLHGIERAFDFDEDPYMKAQKKFIRI